MKRKEELYYQFRHTHMFQIKYQISILHLENINKKFISSALFSLSH